MLPVKFLLLILLHCCTLDDGSTGMEVAIKMAMRLWDKRVKCGRIKSMRANVDVTDDEDLIEDQMKNVIVLTQKDCYHGKIEIFSK